MGKNLEKEEKAAGKDTAELGHGRECKKETQMTVKLTLKMGEHTHHISKCFPKVCHCKKIDKEVNSDPDKPEDASAEVACENEGEHDDEECKEGENEEEENEDEENEEEENKDEENEEEENKDEENEKE